MPTASIPHAIWTNYFGISRSQNRGMTHSRGNSPRSANFYDALLQERFEAVQRHKDAAANARDADSVVCDAIPSGTWVHWVLFDLPADAHDLPEAAGKRAPLPTDAQQGINDFKKEGYGGPCPPPGKPHRYFFKIYALDSKLSLKGSATKADVETAMRGHILGQGELMGRYGR
jgi:Raf kinase inhibitor-like YbhB/YbcL family protein